MNGTKRFRTQCGLPHDKNVQKKTFCTHFPEKVCRTIICLPNTYFILCGSICLGAASDQVF